MYVADIAALSSAGELVLLVEVKTKLRTSEAWAAAVRQNLLAHGSLARAKYFLLAMPDRFYLWQESAAATTPDLATIQIDPAGLLEPYFSRAGLSPEAISHEGFELIIASWLEALLRNRHRPSEADVHHAWISESGLWDALAGGRIECGVEV